MAERVEFDILANGSPAVNEMRKVSKAQDELEDNTVSMAQKMNTSWIAIGAAIGTATLAIKQLGERGANTEKATWNLTSSMKALVADLSKMTGLSQQVTAGFVTTAQSAGLSAKEIEKMTEQAVALGRLYPHESTETFIDNLSMLYTSGEAQGYIVDILEQKYGMLDLKTLSLADKMKVLDEKTKGVNERFSDLASSEISTVSSSWGILFDTLGEKIIGLGKALGIFNILSGAADGLTTGINLLSLRFESTGESVKKFYGWLTNNDDLVKKSQKNIEELAVKYNHLKNGIKTYTEQDVKNAEISEERKKTVRRTNAKLKKQEDDKKFKEEKQRQEQLAKEARMLAEQQLMKQKQEDQATADYNKAMRDAEANAIEDNNKKEIELYNSKVAYINELYQKGIITRLEHERKADVLLAETNSKTIQDTREKKQKEAEEFRKQVEKDNEIRQKASEIVQEINDTELEHKIKILNEETARLEEAGATEIEVREYVASRTKKILEETAGTSEHLYKQMGDTFKNSFADRTTESIMQMVKTGKASFSELASSIMDDLARMIIKQQLFNAISGFSFGGGSTPQQNAPVSFSGENVKIVQAKGGVFSESGRSRFAQGGVFNSPTDFRFAGGAGLLGEKGAEAIMPLKRDASGNLGVVSSGGGASNVKVEVINQSSNQVQASDVKITQSEQNGMIVSIIVDDIKRGGAVAQAIRG